MLELERVARAVTERHCCIRTAIVRRTKLRRLLHAGRRTPVTTP
jgi:hypothetical protein